MAKQIAILQQPTNHDVNVVEANNTLVTINGIPVDVYGAKGGSHFHGLTTYIDIFTICQQQFITIQNKPILIINDTGSVCGSSIIHVKDDKSLQNFIYIE